MPTFRYATVAGSHDMELSSGAARDVLEAMQGRPVLRQRQAWFEKFSGAYTALWWIPKGHMPGIDEAKKRLAHLDAHGPTPFAFTFKNSFPADEQFANSTDWSSFKPRPAT